MNILFRADSSSNIGTGHIMRDLVLATQFHNAKIVFATQKLQGNINYKIKELGYKLKYLQSNNIEELDILIKKLQIDLLIIDHYKIDEAFEKNIKIKNPNLRVMVLDDTYEKHYCDILLNHNICANIKKYKNKVPRNCEVRCGTKFTLLREEFYKEKKRLNKRKKQKKKTIFIAMGGADTAKLNIPILKVLKEFSNIQVELVTTSANKGLNKLQKYAKSKQWINLHINSKEIAKLMGKSDLAIVTPSVTVNEVYFMELPFIAIKTATNQNELYKYLKKKKYPVMKKFKKYVLKKLIKEIQ